MNTLDLQFDRDIAVVEFNRPKAHALNLMMANELSERFAELAASDHIKAVVLTGTGNIFSAGLDLIELYDYDEDKIRRFWQSFGRMVVNLASFPKPLVAAVNGHAPAGGCVLALCCDYRIMASGRGRIGLNEVAVGVVLPQPVVELSRFTVGNEKSMHMILNGVLMDPEEAHEFGLINETCPPELLVEVCKKRIAKWLEFDQTAWSQAKKSLKKPLLHVLDAPFSEAYGETLRHWWAPETRAALGKQIQKLKGGK